MNLVQASASTTRLLVVGNGPTGIRADGGYEVDLTCGHFLLDLAASGIKAQFMQPAEPMALSLNYFGCVLEPRDVNVIGIDRRTALAAVRSSIEAVYAIARSDFVYLFFPGRLPRMVGAICRVIGKRYGVYVRGEQFDPAGADGSLLRGAAFLLTVSTNLVERLAHLNANVSVIRPMSTMAPNEAIRRDYSSRGTGPLRLLFVGRLEADKGVLELLQAAELLRRRGVAIELKLVGLGDLYAELSARYPDPIQSGIFVLGGVEDRAALMRMYEEADIFVLPTHHEGFPRVLYEAMIKSTVVVSTMVGGIPSLLRHEENCLAVPVGDATAIADAVVRLGNSPSLMQQLADKALLVALDVLKSRPPHAEVLREKLAAANAGPSVHSPSAGSHGRQQQNV